MNLLLDTHTLLWLMEANPRLKRQGSGADSRPGKPAAPEHGIGWEMAIKVGLKKMGLSVPLANFLTTAVSGYGLIVLPITTDDCIGYEALAVPRPPAP